MQQYSIQRLSDENLKQLQTLYAQVFDKRVSLGFLQKKYDTRFTGVRFVGFLAFASDGTAAAFYGVLPCYFRIGQQVILAAQSADTMTHPDHRRAGLFLKLARKTFELAKSNGIELIFGFPNQNSLPGFEKLNWKFAHSAMHVFTFPASPFPYAKLLCRVHFARLAINRILRSLYPVRTGSAPLFSSIPDGIVKDEGFIRYKTYSDSVIIAIDNVQVWLRVDGVLKIGYVDTSHISSMDTFLKKLRRIAFWCGCSEVVFLSTRHSGLFGSLITSTPKEGFKIGYYSTTEKEWDLELIPFTYCDIDIF